MKHSGGCQCGSIRYQIEGELGATDICHCRMCQKAFGNFGAVLTRVLLGQFAWTRGKPAIFKSSASVDRGFCGACGTPLFMAEQGDQFIDLATGTLDNPNAVASLHYQIGTESRVQWFKQLTSLPEQTTSQNRPAQELAKIKSLQHPDYDT